MKIKVILAIIPLLACLTACGVATNTADSIGNDITITSDIDPLVVDTTTDYAIPESFCPLGSYDSSPVRVMSPAYAPYLLEIDDNTASELYDAFTNASWELIPSDTPLPDGEAYCVFIYNNGNPYKLVFYADNTVECELGNEIKRYKIEDQSVGALVAKAANPDNLNELSDSLIWCAPEFVSNAGVWREHNYQHIEIEPECGPAYGFSFELPTGWKYEEAQAEEDPTGQIVSILLSPNSTSPVITIEYNSGGLGVCGTGLVSKSIDFNGHTATQGFYKGDDIWSFIALDGDYNGCFIIMNDPDLYNENIDDVDLILKTLNFRFYETRKNTDSSQ